MNFELLLNFFSNLETFYYFTNNKCAENSKIILFYMKNGQKVMLRVKVEV